MCHHIVHRIEHQNCGHIAHHMCDHLCFITVFHRFAASLCFIALSHRFASSLFIAVFHLCASSLCFIAVLHPEISVDACFLRSFVYQGWLLLCERPCVPWFALKHSSSLLLTCYSLAFHTPPILILPSPLQDLTPPDRASVAGPYTSWRCRFTSSLGYSGRIQSEAAMATLIDILSRFSSPAKQN